MSNQLFTIEHFRFPYRAKALKNKLKEANIDSEIENCKLGDIDGFSIKVSVELAPKAIKILENFDRENNEDPLVVLEHFRFPYRAHILTAQLENNGIECYVDENSVFGTIDGSSVRVHQSDLGKAKQIFEAFEKDSTK